VSDLERTVEIIFMGVDSASDIISGLGSGMESFGDKISGIGDPFAEIAKGVTALDLLIVGLGVAALKARSDIEAETVKMGNALAIPSEKAEEFAEVARAVYKEGFGESITEVFEVVTEASRRFGDASTEEIEKITTASFKLSNTFGSEYSDNLSAVQTLMKDFGLSSGEAFDFIAAGFQKGLNGSGDFLESITEYSTQFANGGADAGQFFSVLEDGFQNGILGTDKAADLFKEFRVRIQDESKSTTEALKSIGIDPVEFGKNMASGETTAAEAFAIIQEHLNNTQDKTVQFNAGVALMGTQFEDMGTLAALAVTTTSNKLDELSGTMDKINPDETLGAKFRNLIRDIETTIIGADFWDGLENGLKPALDDIKSSFDAAFKDADFSDVESAFERLISTISDEFGDMDLDITTVEGMSNAINLIKNSIETLLNISGGMAETFMPLISFAKDAVEWFSQLSPYSQEIIGNFIGLGSALTVLGGILGVGGVLVGGIANLVALFSSGGALATGLSLAVMLLTGPAGIAVALGVVGAALGAFTLGSIASESEEAKKKSEELLKKLDEFYAKVKEIGDSETRIEIMALIEKRDFDAAQKLIDEWIEEDKETRIRIEAENKAFDEYWTKMQEIPEEKETRLLAYMNAGEMDAVKALLDDIPDEQQIDILTKADTSALADVKKELEQVGTRADGSPIYAEVTAKSKDIDKVKKDIEAIPTEKMLEIKLQGDIDMQLAQIESSAEMAQTAFEWTAKVNIAEAEAAAKVGVAAFDAIGESVSSLSSSVSDMFSSLVSGWSDLDMGAQWDFMDILEDQQSAQNDALASQVKLNEAQAEYMRQKAASLAKGGGLITIDSKGLEPALEMVMWEIIKKVQLTASKEASELLLGV